MEPYSNLQLENLLAVVGEAHASCFVSPDCQGGILLKGQHYNDVIFPGGALIVPSRLKLVAYKVVGQIELCPSSTLAVRQMALSNRITGTMAVQSIFDAPEGRQRAHLIIKLLHLWFGEAGVKQLSLEDIACLVAVTPKQIAVALDQFEVAWAHSRRVETVTEMARARQEPLPNPWPNVGEPALMAYQAC